MTTTFAKLLGAPAELLAELELRTLALLEEFDLRTAVELLPEWSAFLDLFDDCTDGLPATALEQRFAAFRKLTSQGGQSPLYFVEVAQALGYDVEIMDLEEHREFVAGRGRAGDPLSNNGWAFTVTVHAPEFTPRFARADLCAAGEPIVSAGNGLLECTLDRLKPAHVLFVYAFDKLYVGYAPWSLEAPPTLRVSLVLPSPKVL